MFRYLLSHLHRMVRRMASTLSPALVVFVSLLGGAGASAQEAAGQVAGLAPQPAQSQAAANPSEPSPGPLAEGKDAAESSLSPECRVPGSKLYTLAPLKAV